MPVTPAPTKSPSVRKPDDSKATPATKQPSKSPALSAKTSPTSPTKPSSKPKNVGISPIKETNSQVHSPVEKQDVSFAEVTHSLVINHVFGYRSKERRNNLFYLPTALNATDADLMVYTAGSVGIIHQKSSNQQLILQGHNDDVLGIAIHPNSRIVATGQVGRDAFINIYKIGDTKFGKLPEQVLLKTLKVPRGSNGINGLAFNKDADLLFAFTRGDPNNEILIYDWNADKLLTSTRVSNKILDLVASPFKKNEFLAVGVKYIAFGSFVNGKLEMKRGEFGNAELIQALPCCCYFDAETVLTGTSTGSIYVWKSAKLVHHSSLLINGNVLSLKRDMNNNVYIGGKEGKVLTCTVNNDAITVNDTFTLTKDQADDAELPAVCSIDYSSNKLLLGLRNSTIVEVDVSKKDKVQTKLVNAHDTTKDFELWGLDIKGNVAITCGDDGFIKVWNLLDRKCVVKIKVGSARSICWHPKLNKIACGLRNGTVYVFEGDDSSKNWTQMNKFTVSQRDVTVIKYSPNGKYLITGASDGKIDVYDASNNHTRIGEMSGHTSRILSADWNVESLFLQSNSTDKEVLYWDVEGMKQLTNVETIKQLKWATTTNIFAWSTMGIWQQSAIKDATDINCVHGHGKLLVDGTDTTVVQLWNWPRPKSKNLARNYF
eukprot:NODE_500_length_7578_cov_0.067790.p1 type:complete len:659 gc:universal NODE_500_length_7578_cov_0.067790:4258-2282(-)